MKSLIKNFGFSKIEIIVVLCAIIVLFVIGIKSLLVNSELGNYSVLKREADNFIYKVSVYKDMYPRNDNIYYLDYLLDDKYQVDLLNPFDKTVECDRYESFVKLEENSKSVVLKCGNYLIEGTLDKEYVVYELSSWMEDSISGESRVLYNYKKNGMKVLDHYMLDNEFLDFYNKQENTNIYSISDINSPDIELLTKVFYREKKIVKEFN